MADEQQQSSNYSILVGTVAQALGGSVASVVVLGLASFKIYLAAGFESAFGSLLGILAYIFVKKFRQTKL